MFDQLPNDPVMLLSFVNTQLRDHYSDLAAFTEAYETDQEAIIAKLKTIDYEYDAATNQFI